MIAKTIELLSEDGCTGCKLCSDVCPVQAIDFASHKDGFWYPVVDSAKCIECGLCHRKCPSLNAGNVSNQAVLKCYGAKTKKEDIRYQSTSGGFFTELAIKWVSDGGVVIGAAYNESHMVYHTFASTEQEIEKLRQSKYVQSDTCGIYATSKELVASGKKVLFCGTPCQVEAFLAYLGKKYDNVLSMDFVCCGICSPEIYKHYLSMLEKRFRSSISRVWFKNKREGWKNIGMQVDFEDGRQYFRIGTRDLLMNAFVTDGLSIRPSCEHCRYRKLPHSSDIMLGDFWGIEKVNPEFDDNKGLSAILINSVAGLNAFDSIKDRLDYFETTADEIARGNFTIYESKPANPNRQAFIDAVCSQGFEKAMARYGSYAGLRKLKIDLRYIGSKLKKSIRR